MRLDLIRHGEALSAEADPRRPLSPRGREEARRVAEFIRPLRLAARAVWHSGKPRTSETAAIVMEALKDSGAGLAERPGLSPNDSPEALYNEVSLAAEADLMIVGHMPHLGKLAALLLTGRANDDFSGSRPRRARVLSAWKGRGCCAGWRRRSFCLRPRNSGASSEPRGRAVFYRGLRNCVTAKRLNRGGRGGMWKLHEERH